MSYVRKIGCIDSHSHFSIKEGGDKVGIEYYFGREGNLDEYCNMAVRNHIVEAMLMPCPTPVIISENGSRLSVPVTWTEKDGKIVYFSRTVEAGREVIDKPKVNPYSEVNSRLWRYLKTYDSKGVKLNFVPLIHLVYDNMDYLEELISQRPKAFKFHGIGLGIDDFHKVNIELIKRIGKSGIPVIVHTDYMDGTPGSKIEEVYKENDPLNWIKILERCETRALLTHGVRLCKQSAEIVNKSQLFRVGISPDLLIQSEPTRLKMGGDYLQNLLELVGTEYLLFDVDYPWNVTDRYSLTSDEGVAKRLMNYMSGSELEAVFYDNAHNFFT